MGQRFFAVVIQNNRNYGKGGIELDRGDKGDKFPEGMSLDQILKDIRPGYTAGHGAKLSVNGSTVDASDLEDMELEADTEIEIMKQSEGGDR